MNIHIGSNQRDMSHCLPHYCHQVIDRLKCLYFSNQNKFLSVYIFNHIMMILYYILTKQQKNKRKVKLD